MRNYFEQRKKKIEFCYRITTLNFLNHYQIRRFLITFKLEKIKF